MAKKEGVSDVVKKVYKSSKGSGVRKIHHKLKNSYIGFAERDVQKVLAKSSVHQRLNIRFENKARLGGYEEIALSIIDVFSRYHWLVPLQTKKSSHLACELFRVYTEHGAPCGGSVV